MPRMSNGIGTWFCPAHFDPGWGWDDAAECAMFVFFPVWPLRVVHLRQIPGGSFAPDRYQAIPLRWSDDLVRHVMLRRWAAGSVVAGVFIALLLVFVTLSPPTGEAAKRDWAVSKPILTPVAPCLIAAGLAGLWSLRHRARRERDVRRVLGPHELGTSDPASWVDEDLAKMPPAEALFGTPTDADAVPKLLQAGAWSGAMWAARLAAARGGHTGDELTDEVLRHPGTQEALARVRLDKSCWPDAMGAEALKQYRARLAQPAGDG